MDKLVAEIAKQKNARSGKGWVRREELEQEHDRRYLKNQEEQNKEREERHRKRQEAKMLEREAELKTQQQVLERAIEKQLVKLNQPPKLPGETLEAKQTRLEEAKVAAKEPSNDLTDADLNDPVPYNTRDFIEKALEYEAREERGELEVLRNEHPYLTEVNSMSYLDKAKILFTWYKIMLLDWESSITTTHEQQSMFKELKEAASRLFRLIRTHKLHDQILSRLVLVVRHCQIKSYVRANNQISDEQYWDAYETKQYVNDETRRRITQNLKRMLTMCQKLHPADNTKTWL